MILFILILSCSDILDFKNKDDYKTYKSVPTFYLEILNKNKSLVSDLNIVMSLDNRVVNYFYNKGSIYFFDILESGNYSLEITSNGYNIYFSYIDIVLKDNKILFKGDNQILLQPIQAEELKIYSPYVLNLSLEGIKNINLESKNSFFSFNLEDIGEYCFNFNSNRHKVSIFLLNDKLAFSLDNVLSNMIDLGLLKKEFKICLDNSVISLSNRDIIDISTVISSDSKGINIVDQSLRVEENSIVSEVSFMINKATSFDLSFNILIGEFSYIFNDKYIFDGLNILGNRNFVSKDIYSVLIFDNYHDMNKLDIDYSVFDSSIAIKDGMAHIFGKRNYIMLKGKSFEDIKIDILEDYSSVSFEPKMNHPKDIIFLWKELPENTEAWLVYQQNDIYTLFYKITTESLNEIIFPDISAAYYVLYIQRNSENNIVDQSLISIFRSRIGIYKSGLDSNLHFTRNIQGMFSISGTIFLDIHNEWLNSLMRYIKSYNPGIDEVLINVSVENSFFYKEASLGIIKKKNEYLFNITEDSFFRDFGNSIGVNFGSVNTELSVIKPNDDINYNLTIYGISSLEDISISEGYKLYNYRNIEVKKESIYLSKDTYISLYRKSIPISPIYSNQSFEIIISYGTSNIKDLSIGNFYENFVYDSRGSERLIMNENNIDSNGDFGQNFHTISFSKNDKKSDGVGLILGSVVNILRGDLLSITSSILSAFIGTYNFMKDSRYYDNTNWDSNFKDSNGKKLAFIPNFEEKNYSIEWHMYVYISPFKKYTFKAPIISGSGGIIDIIIKVEHCKTEAIILNTKFSNESVSSLNDCDFGADGWSIFTLKINKRGHFVKDWGVIFDIPFDIYRNTDEAILVDRERLVHVDFLKK
jgi:hypothetical protein